MKCTKCKEDMEEDEYSLRCKNCKLIYDKGFEEWFEE